MEQGEVFEGGSEDVKEVTFSINRNKIASNGFNFFKGSLINNFFQGLHFAPNFYFQRFAFCNK